MQADFKKIYKSHQCNNKFDAGPTPEYYQIKNVPQTMHYA
jgi:hypothetical protein